MLLMNYIRTGFRFFLIKFDLFSCQVADSFVIREEIGSSMMSTEAELITLKDMRA